MEFRVVLDRCLWTTKTFMSMETRNQNFFYYIRIKKNESREKMSHLNYDVKNIL